MMRPIDMLPALSFNDRPGELVNRFLEDWQRPFFASNQWDAWFPAADIRETDQHYELSIEVPGIDMKDLDIAYDQGHLIVKGEKTKESTTEHENCYCSERFSGRFERRFPISGRVAEDGIRATLKNGVLTVTLPKAEESRPKKIEIH